MHLDIDLICILLICVIYVINLLVQSGPDLTTEETWGVNYRALRDLFHISKERAGSIKYEVFVQMIEIYNEQVRHFLVSHGSNKRYPLSNLYMLVLYSTTKLNLLISHGN